MASASGTKRKLDSDPVIPEAGDCEMKSTRYVIDVCMYVILLVLLTVCCIAMICSHTESYLACTVHLSINCEGSHKYGSLEGKVK